MFLSLKSFSPYKKHKSSGGKFKVKPTPTGGKSTAYFGSKNKIASVTDTRAYKEQKQAVDLPILVGFYPSGSLTLLNGLKSGSAFYERGNSRRVRMKSVRVSGCIRYLPSVTNNGQYTFNLAMVYDRNPNGAPPTYADIFLDYDKDGSTSSGAFSGVNMALCDRFVVLRRQSWVNYTGTTTGTSSVLEQTNALGPHAMVDWYVKLQDTEAHYTASSGSIGDIASGALYLILFTDQGGGETCQVDFKGSSRLRFISQ